MHNLFVNPLYILIIYAIITIGPQPSFNLSADLVTATPTSGLLSRTPTATSGTPTHTYTPSSTPSQTATTTLRPLPAFTLIFPVATRTSTATLTPLSTPRAGTSEPVFRADDQNISPRIQFLVIVLILLWLILAGFLIVFIRQLK